MFINKFQKRTGRALRSALALPLLAGLTLIATGCGPGFPIMTSEQELLVSNVNKLMEENSKLKERVATIEDSGASGNDLEDARISLADSKAELGRIRDEFSFIRSSFEENELAIGQLKADTESADEKIDSISMQLTEITASLDNTATLITSLAAAKEADITQNIELNSAIEEINSRLTTLEESLKSRTAEQKAKTGTKNGLEAATGKEEGPAPKELYAQGLKATKAKEYSRASKTFKAFLSAHPKHDLADNAQYWLGEIFYDTGEYERAILEFNKVITGYPDGDKRAAATLKQGFSFEKLGALKESRVLLETVIELYPKSEEAAKAKKRLEQDEKQP